MAIFEQCDFHDSATLPALSAHTACDVGVHTAGLTYTKLTAGSGNVRITSAGRAQAMFSSAGIYLLSGTPADADYTVSAGLYVASDIGTTKLLARHNGTNTYYAAYFNKTLGRWQIDKVISGTTTQIGTTTALAGLTVGQLYALQFDLQGSALTLRVDGAVVAQATDSAIVAAGKVGLHLQGTGNVANENTWYQIESISVDDVVIGAGGSGGGGGGTVTGSGGRLVATHRVRAQFHVRRGSGTVVTPPTDTTPPIIVPGTILVTPTTTTLVVTWQTDKSATSVVRSGTTTAYGTTTTGTGGVTSHTVTVPSLTANTAYHLQISTVGTVSLQETVSDDIAVSTSAVVDVTPPVISAEASGTPGQTTATVTWTTDEASDSQVEYGTTTAYGSTTALDATLVTSHSVALSALLQGTPYHYRVRSKDASLNQGIGTDHTFTTATPIPAPTISNVSVTSITASHATINGSVDLASTVTVLYGTVSGSLGNTTSGVAVPAGGSFSIPLSGLSGTTTEYYQIRAVGAGGTTTTTQSSFVTGAPVASLSTMTLIGVDADTGVLGDYTDTNGAITSPIKVTYNSIGVDLRFTRATACDPLQGNPTAWARFKKAGEPNADWSAGVGGWRYHVSDMSAPVGEKGRVPRFDRIGSSGALDKAFVFSFIMLDPNVTYECEIHVTDTTSTPTTVVVPFTVTTWVDAITPPAQLAVTHYVNFLMGVDTNRTETTARNPATPWKTINRAVTAAPSGAVVEIAAGLYPTPDASPGASIRSAAQGPITLKGATPCVADRDPTTRVIAPLTTPHVVICGSFSAAPTGEPTSDPWGVYTPAGVAPWTTIQVVGPRNGHTYTLWRWQPKATFGGAVGLVYGSNRWGPMTRMQHLDSPGSYTAPTFDEPLLNTPGGFAEVINTTTTCSNASIVINNTIYMVWVRPEDPNSFWWDTSQGSREGILLRADHCRISQIHIRAQEFAIDFGSTSSDSSNITDTIIDRCWTDAVLYGVRITCGGATTVDYRNGLQPSRATIQNCLFSDYGFRDRTLTWQPWNIQWAFVKEYMGRDPDPAGPWPAYVAYPGRNNSITDPTKGGYWTAQGRLGGKMESTAFVTPGGMRQLVFRNNHVDGPFNGLTTIAGDGKTRYRGENVDGTGNLYTAVADDCMEPEEPHTNMRYWDNWMTNTVNPLSMAPADCGPYYYVRNVSWETGLHGMGQFRDSTFEANAVTGPHKERDRFQGGGINNLIKTSAQGDTWLYWVHNTHWTQRGNKPATVDETQGCHGINESAYTDPSGIPQLSYMYIANSIFRVTGYAARWGALVGRYRSEDYNLIVTSNTTLGLRINGGSTPGIPIGAFGVVYTSTDPAQSIVPYRTYISGFNGRPSWMSNPDHTNNLGGSDIAFCGSSAVAAVDALFTDVTAGIPGMALKSGTNPAVNAGKAVCNISDRAGVDYNGSAPDLGAVER